MLSDLFSFLPLISAACSHSHSCFKPTVFCDEGLPEAPGPVGSTCMAGEKHVYN